MTVTIPQVEASRPEDLTQMATELGQKASGLASQIDNQRANIERLRSGWQGTASEAAIAKARPTLQRLQDIHDAITHAQTVLQHGGSTLTQARTTLMQTVSQLSGQGWQVGPDGSVSVRPGSPMNQFAKFSTSNAMKIQQLAATNSVNVKTLLAGFDTADRALDQNLRRAVGGLDVVPAKFGVGGNPPEASPYDIGAQIPAGKTPEEVQKWWDTVPKDEQQRLLHTWPDKLGNLDGVPVADRSTANQVVMQQDIDRVADVAAARGVTADEVKAHPGLYGMAGPMMDRYNNALKVQAALTSDSEKTGGAPTFLQVYDPEAFSGDGRAAIAIGDPDKAANTAVVVPGTGNGVNSGWLASADATNLFTESNNADRSHPTAVVAWMGYDAPDALYDPRVGATGLAHEGGQLLASDVNGLNVTHDTATGDGHMTVLGHSYGSTTVSDAAAGYGMHADDVVLVGCPGTDMAHSATDFHLNDGGHLYVGAASSDPITQLGSISQVHVPGTDFTASLGDDPARDDFGSTRFKAEVPGLTAPWSDHSQYYARGNESLFSMSDIVSGHGDALEHDGMTAAHRGTGLSQVLGELGLDDPEIYRQPTSGHSHQ